MSYMSSEYYVYYSLVTFLIRKYPIKFLFFLIFPTNIGILQSLWANYNTCYRLILLTSQSYTVFISSNTLLHYGFFKFFGYDEFLDLFLITFFDARYLLKG